MTPWRKPIQGFMALGLIAAFGGAVHYLPHWKPDGFPAGKNTTYEGRLTIPERGWLFALLDTKSLILENERSRKRGVQRVEIVCLLPSSHNRSLVEAAKRAPPDANGARRIWVGVIAEPRLATGECMDWYQRTGKSVQHWGRYLRLIEVRSAEPMKDNLHFADGRPVA